MFTPQAKFSNFHGLESFFAFTIFHPFKRETLEKALNVLFLLDVYRRICGFFKGNSTFSSAFFPKKNMRRWLNGV
jgi:hypothetical protein